MNVCKYDFGVRTSPHKPKYELWSGLTEKDGQRKNLIASNK